MRTRPIVLLVVGLLVVLSAGRADAITQADQWTDGSGIGAGAHSEQSSAGTGQAGSGKGSDVICTYTYLDPSQVQFINDYAMPQQLNSGNGALNSYNAICTEPNGAIVSVNQFQVPAPVDPIALAQQAFDYRKLPVPQITLNPTLAAPQLVNLPTWLSVSSQTWNPVTASASSGGVTATTTATPTHVLWTAGDGGSVTCNDPGATYNSAVSGTQQHSDCTYAYTRSSKGAPNGAFTLTATVSWSVNWTATGVQPGQPTTGALNAVTRTASVPVQVDEASALNQITN